MMARVGTNVEMRVYRPDELKYVLEELRKNLPLELTFANVGDVDILEFKESGWILCRELGTDKKFNIRTPEFIKELVENNSYLLNYVLEKIERV